MLYWILPVYLVVACFFPVVGWLAVVCMVGPVLTSVFRGRHWCGHFCPRGNFYDKVIGRISLNRRIPRFLRSVAFRTCMVGLIFTVFGVQMYAAWGDWAAMGRVFWLIILLTTVVGIVLGVAYAPRAWCTFCPMGSLSAAVAPRTPRKGFKNIHVGKGCIGCKKCAKACPMQLAPYRAKGAEGGLADADCIKCGACVGKCPKRCMSLREA